MLLLYLSPSPAPASRPCTVIENVQKSIRARDLAVVQPAYARGTVEKKKHGRVTGGCILAAQCEGAQNDVDEEAKRENMVINALLWLSLLFYFAIRWPFLSPVLPGIPSCCMPSDSGKSMRYRVLPPGSVNGSLCDLCALLLLHALSHSVEYSARCVCVRGHGQLLHREHQVFAR